MDDYIPSVEHVESADLWAVSLPPYGTLALYPSERAAQVAAERAAREDS